MIWRYEYTKENVDGEVLNEMILFNSNLRAKSIGISIAGTDIECCFNAALEPSEHDELNVIIDQYGPSHELVVRKGIETNTMVKCMKFGESFLAKFTANNIYREKSSAQISSLLSTYPDLIHCCITGSLQSLYYIISNMVASENISQDEIDEFKLRLEIFLGI